MHFSENSGTNSSSNVTEIFVADFFSLVFFNIFYSHIGNRKIAFNIGFASWRTKTFPETSNVSTSIGIFNDGNIWQKCLFFTKDKIRSNFVHTFISIQDGSLTNFRKKNYRYGSMLYYKYQRLRDFIPCKDPNNYQEN